MMKKIFAVVLLVGICAAEYSAQNSQTDYKNSICDCVPYHQCNIDGLMNDDGKGIVDIRNNSVGTVDNPQSGRKTCDDIRLICCFKNELTPGNNVSPVESPTGGHGGEEKSLIGVHERSGRPNVKPHISKGCGYRNLNGVGIRITENFNNQANSAEFPWMVAILKVRNIGRDLTITYQCGGSLIHPRAILTAAHCVHGKSASELIIRAGEWDTRSVSEALPHQDRGVSVIIPHPKYNDTHLYNDFALLILNKPVDLADNVETVCLPEKDEYYEKSNCFVTGWRVKGEYQTILKATKLPAVPRDKCQDSLRKTRLGRDFILHESSMCAGGVDRINTCTGEGGSPLVCPLADDPTRYTQAGIVSWGIECAQDGVPGVYGDVTKVRPWIDEQLSSYNIDSTSYSPGENSKYPPGHGAGSPDFQHNQGSGSHIWIGKPGYSTGRK